MHWFYSENIAQGKVYLQHEEAHHAFRVMRLKPGDDFIAIDGKGGYYECEIMDATKKEIIGKIKSEIKNYKSRNYKIHIAIVPPKNISRFEWFLEKSIEMGIDEISIIWSANSERKKVNMERLQKILLASTKQSQKATLAKLNEPIPFKEFVSQAEAEEKFIAYCDFKNNEHLVHKIQSAKDCLILIGPEGDFNDSEIKMAKEAGFIGVGLGTERLRTETAAILACLSFHLEHEKSTRS